MQSDNFDRTREAGDRLMDEINAGASVPRVDPSELERLWQAHSRLPRGERYTKALGLGAVAGLPDAEKLFRDPEKFIPTGMRLHLLNSLVERGVLNEYMQSDESRKRVFLAAATMPCTKQDVSEALALSMLSQGPSDVAQEIRKRMQEEAYDPDHPEIGRKFIAWMRDNC